MFNACRKSDAMSDFLNELFFYNTPVWLVL